MPSKRPLPAVVAVVALVIAVVGIGVVAFWPSESGESAPPIGHNASDRLAALDGYVATVETVTEHANGTNRTVYREWRRPGTGKYYREPVDGERQTRLVSNGSVTWLHDLGENNVTRFDIDTQQSLAETRGERLERIFTRLNVSRDAVDETEQTTVTPSGDAPLPAVPTGQSGAASTSPDVGAADGFGVRYQGTDTVAGREVYVLTIQPETDDDVSVLDDYQQTLYVDTEWFLTLKRHTEFTRDGETFATTVTYRNVTVEPGIDDDRFEYDPPENATVTDPDLPDVSTYDSRSALRAATSLPVPDPDIPGGFEFDGGTVTSGRFRSVNLQYTSPRAQLGVGVSNVTGENTTGTDTGETVVVDGREATYQRVATSQLVTWECNGYRYSVSGNGVDRETLLDVAASVECD